MTTLLIAAGGNGAVDDVYVCGVGMCVCVSVCVSECVQGEMVRLMGMIICGSYAVSQLINYRWVE
jgi:hypothetical protein